MKKVLLTLTIMVVLSGICNHSFAQARLIKGVVYDNTKNTLPGVTVRVKDGKAATVTATNGSYAINAATGDILQFSFIGYLTKEIEVGKESFLNVIMEASNQTLNDVVVVGYGTVKKRDLTGSVATLNAESISEVPSVNVNDALQGKAAGVLVAQSDMRPGGQVRVNIRGISSINNGTDPIYVVDGVIMQGNINELNISDIESVDILKDASSAAIYGARGANGVVIITTKQGKSGRFQVNYDGYVGTQSILKKLSMMNGAQYAQLRRDADYNVAVQDGRAPLTDQQLFTPLELQSIQQGKSYDWQNAILRNAVTTNHTLSFSGGDNKTTFYVSGNYLLQDGIVINSDFDRKSGKASVSHDFGKIKLGGTINISRTKEDIVPGSIFYAALSASPLIPFQNPDGSYPLIVANSFADNPIANAKFITNLQLTNRSFGNAYAEVNLLPELKLRSSFGFDNFQRTLDYYAPRTVQSGNSANGYASITDQFNNYWNWENTLTYNKTFKQHKINVVAGYTMEENNNNNNSVSAQDFPTDFYTYKNLAAGQVRNQPSSYFERWAIASLLGRINYTFKDRYLVTVTGRYDGNSKFGANNKYAFFPSAALGWRFSEEKFFPKSDFITNGKLRISYGASGNPNFSSYQSFTQLVADNSTNYSFNGQTVTGIGNSNSRLGNPNIKWEIAYQLNTGLDLSLLKDRINLTVDYFDIQNNNLILDRSLPPSSGFSVITYNIGGLRNKGIDVNINARIIDHKDFHWDLGFNWSRYRNKITSLEGGVQERLVEQPDYGYNLLKVGQPLGLRYDYLFGGVWQKGDNIIRPGGKPGVPGDMKIVDVNGDGKIDASDQTVVGNLNPKWYGGFNTNIRYQQLSLSAVFNYKYGNDVVNRVWDFYMDGRGTYINNLTDMLNRWTPSNTNTTVPRATIDFRHYDNSSRYMEKGSYLRVRTLTLAYDIKSSWLKTIGLTSCRAYVSAINPFTITHYRGYDPESDPSGFGTDVYPNSKSLMCGVNVSF